MASYDRRTKNVTLDGTELLKVTALINGLLADSGGALEGLEVEVQIRLSLEPGMVTIGFTEKTRRNPRQKKLEFEIDYIWPDDNQ